MYNPQDLQATVDGIVHNRDFDKKLRIAQQFPSLSLQSWA